MAQRISFDVDINSKSADLQRYALINFPADIAPTPNVETKRPIAPGVDPELVKHAASQGAGGAGDVDPARIELVQPDGGSPDKEALKMQLGRMREALNRFADSIDPSSAGDESDDDSGTPSASGRLWFANCRDVGLDLLLALVKIQQENRKADVTLLSTDLKVQREANLSEAETFRQQGQNALASAFTSGITEAAFGIGGAALKMKGIKQEARSLQNNAMRAGELREMNAKMEDVGPDGALSKRAVSRELQAQELDRKHKMELTKAQMKETRGMAIQSLGSALAKLGEGAFAAALGDIQANRKLLENAATTMQSAVSRDVENLQGLSRQLDEILNRLAEISNAHLAAATAMADRV